MWCLELLLWEGNVNLVMGPLNQIWLLSTGSVSNTLARHTIAIVVNAQTPTNSLYKQTCKITWMKHRLPGNATFSRILLQDSINLLETWRRGATHVSRVCFPLVWKKQETKILHIPYTVYCVSLILIFWRDHRIDGTKWVPADTWQV